MLVMPKSMANNPIKNNPMEARSMRIPPLPIVSKGRTRRGLMAQRTQLDFRGDFLRAVLEISMRPC